ncbi:RTA1 like protein [Trichoderma sp. SZMC 28011]
MALGPWSYNPSPAAALLFAILFGIATLYHIFIVFRRHVWHFLPLVVGGGFESVGYVVRYLASKDEANIALFVIQTLLILVAPALFAASIYMVLGRLILAVRAEAYTPIRPTWLTKIFVGGDVLSFVVQLAGSGLLTNNFSLGKAIILVGLVAQLTSFGLFVVTAIIFQRRLARNPTPESHTLDSRNRMQWKSIMFLLYSSSALIFVRSVFRLIEFTGSNNSAIMTSEAYLYVCDSTLMFIVLAILGYFHPSEYLRKDKGMAHLQGEELL